MHPCLPAPARQLERLTDLGVARLAGLTAADVARLARALTGATALENAALERRALDGPGADGAPLLVLPGARPSALAPLLQREGKAGFVVADMVDVDDFAPVVPLPGGHAYLVRGVRRGDDLRGATPREAGAALAAAGRTPLTLQEGLHLLLQRGDLLEPGFCFMTIASRKPHRNPRRREAGDVDARTPALWISGGTGREGKARKGAPKLGWCWENNPHSWLGFASGTSRAGLSVPA